MRERLAQATFQIGLIAVAAIVVVAGSFQDTAHAQNARTHVPRGLSDRVARDGSVRVLVQVDLPGHVPEGRLPNDTARNAQRGRLNAAQMRVLGRLGPTTRVMRRYRTLPYLALEVDARALALLDSDANVVRVMDDPILRPFLNESGPLVQADQTWAAGFDGAGTTIAVLDTGVDRSHPFLADKVVEEACFSSQDPGASTSFCPNGQSEQIGTGAAATCWLDGCAHGTHAAGIAAGDGTRAGQPFSGIARGASLMAVQVFSQIDANAACGGVAPCLGGFASDLIAGLERVYLVAGVRHVVVADVGAGAGQFGATCDSEPYQPIIESLRAIGVATIAAAGNGGSTSSVAAPACVSTAISVGASDKSDRFASFSNAASFLSFLAPGEGIRSSVEYGSYGTLDGTSMAAAHVAGAWAVLKQAAPDSTVTDVFTALRNTGKPIADSRPNGAMVTPRVRLYQALASMVPVANPPPVITSLSPERVRATGPAFTLTVAGAGFNAFSVVRWNGAERPTTVVNVNTIQAAIGAADINLASAGTAEVSVFTSAPGGGTSNVITLPIDPPPSIAVSSTTVAPGGPVTMTLMNGFGGAKDWLSWAAVGSPDASFIDRRDVGAGATTTSWTLNVPATTGQFEFRLFLDDGYTRKATSPAVTVALPPNPQPALSSISPNHVLAGTAGLTVTIAGSNFVPKSVVRWNGTDCPTTYVSGTGLQAMVPVVALATPATALVTVFTPAPGGGTSSGLTFTIDPPPSPSLAVNATSIVVGSQVTVSLTNGFGGATDWLALAVQGAPNTTYLQWTYIGAGVASRTWTVTIPNTGTYEFRLFPNNGFVTAATSPAVTVTPPPTPTLTVSATHVTPGAAVTASLTNGYGGLTDWLALAATNAPNSSYLQWVYVGGGVTTRTWTVNMPTTPGTYEFRLFLNNGFTRAATSPTIMVGP